MKFSQQRNKSLGRATFIFLLLIQNIFSCLEMTNKTEFLVEQDCFSMEADVEEGIEEKWWKLAKHLLGEQRSERYNYYVDN